MATIAVGFTSTKERQAAVRRLGRTFGKATEIKRSWIIFKNRQLAASAVRGLVLNGECFDLSVNDD